FEQSKAKMEFPVTKHEHGIALVRIIELQSQVAASQKNQGLINQGNLEQLQRERDEKDILKQALSIAAGNQVTVQLNKGAMTNMTLEDFLNRYYSTMKQFDSLQREKTRLQAELLIERDKNRGKQDPA